MSLLPKIKQQLKAKAHRLNPIVILGHQGLTANVLKEIDRGLHDHELIKIKINCETRDEKYIYIQEIAEKLNAETVQVIGKICVLYRKNID